MMIPDPTLPKYPIITPRPFDIVIEARELKDKAALHPFQILMSRESGETRLRVNAGRLIVLDIFDVDGTAVPKVFDVPVPFGPGADLANDDFGMFGGASGYHALANSTTYGVFIGLGLSSAKSIKPNYTNEHRFLRGYTWSASGIYTSIDYVTPGEETDFAEAEGLASALFLGRVEVDASGSAVVFQYRKSDVSLPGIVVPSGFISQQPFNDLNASYVDNPGLYVKVVSEDDDNSLSYGSDGGAYYNAP